MAKSEFFTDKGKFVKNFMKVCGAFPVKRNSSDLNAVNDAGELLKKGKVTAIFPQGRIARNINEFEPKAGAALLSVKNNVPIVPVSIYTESRRKPFSKITVRIGKPIENSEDDSIKSARKLTIKVKEQIKTQLEGKHCL